MNKFYKSVFGDYISKYILFKRKIGYKFESQEWILGNLDKIAFETKQIGPGISKEFSEIWKNAYPHEHIKTKQLRVVTLIGFSSFLSDLGISSYIPQTIKKATTTFTPYIYSFEEINKLIRHSDLIQMKKRNKKSTLFSFPLFIRYLYATGIRIGEAFALKEEDVNLEHNFIVIKDSKNGKERMIPISSSLAEASRKFLHYKKFICPNKHKDYFFIDLAGNQCGSIIRHYKMLLNNLNIRCQGNNNTPRIHDLRHTFAVHSLVNMSREGLDMYTALPILSNYLGHVQIESTEKYVRLTRNMFPELIEKIDNSLLNVYPKIEK